MKIAVFPAGRLVACPSILFDQDMPEKAQSAQSEFALTLGPAAWRMSPFRPPERNPGSLQWKSEVW